MKSRLFAEHAHLSSLMDIESITPSFLRQNELMVEDILGAGIGVKRMFFTLHLQKWSDEQEKDGLKQIGLTKQIFHMVPPNFKVDHFIILYEVTFDQLRSIGVNFIEISGWPIGRLKQIGLNADEMIQRWGMTKIEFIEFKPKMKQWSERMGLKKSILFNLKFIPRILRH